MAQTWGEGFWKLGQVSFVVIGGALALGGGLSPIAFKGDCVLAQVTPDGTLGSESSVVTPTAPGSTVDVIQGGATRGANLFHSFEQFSVPTGGEAFFNNALDIQNIISRVTGESISNIDGLLRANGTANLFLLNPNGIAFGSNASLNIGGSFVGSTASSLNFADGTQFSATAPTTTPLLTVSVPIGLQYGGNAGRIQVQGNGEGLRSFNDPIIDTTVGLRVQPNQTLALVGSDVALEGGTLKTAGGRIELGSVAGPGLVSLTPIDSGWALGYEGVPTFGDIQLSQQATVDASGAGGGDIQVQGRRVTLTNGSQIEASTLGAEPGGTLNVNASDSVELIGRSVDGRFFSGLYAQVYPGATGSGGNLTVETGQLIVRDGAGVTVDTLGTGAGGALSIATGRLLMRDGARILANTYGTGAGGTLSVTASDAIELIGRSANGRFPSALFAQTQGEGNAGDLTIATGRLTVRDGAVVSTVTYSTGAGGTLSVRASDAIEVIGRSADGRSRSGLYSQTQGEGNAGDLTIATGRLTVRDGAEVSVRSLRSANAGSLRVAAGSVLLENKGRLLASTASGEGGNIDLQIQDLILMRGNSLISAEAGGTGNSGNITINAPFTVAVPAEDSDIIANAFQGRGGNIEITTQGIYGLEYRSDLTSESDINASSQFGVSGTVEINTPDVDPSQGLVVLPTELVDASNSFDTSCAGGGENEFIITGRGGLPPNPYEPLDSSEVWRDVQLPRELAETEDRVSWTSTSPTMTPGRIVEATGWIVNENGKVELVANVPTAISQERCDVRS